MIKTPLSTVIGGAFWTPGATILGSASRTLNQIIKSLFANNEQGFAYDPNDLTTMFQDAAGTVPVTGVGQAVGLIRDKSGRNNHAFQTTSSARPIFQQKPILGNELITNGNFETSITPLTMILTSAVVENAKCRLTVNSTGGRLEQSIPTVAGKTYQLSWEAQSIVSVPMIRVGTASGLGNLLSVNDATGKRSAVFTAGGTSTFIGLTIQGAGGRAYFDNISVKEVTGYRTDQNYIKYDGVDDKLITNLPAQLTGCTVIRSVPNVGTQILTGQTIPATYEDNTDHCGLLVINRALTPSETSAITAEFNKRAGV